MTTIDHIRLLDTEALLTARTQIKRSLERSPDQKVYLAGSADPNDWWYVRSSVMACIDAVLREREIKAQVANAGPWESDRLRTLYLEGVEVRLAQEIEIARLQRHVDAAFSMACAGDAHGARVELTEARWGA